MNDAFHLVRGDHALDEVLVGGIANEQRHAFGQECGKAGGEVVDHDDAFAGFHQRVNHVTSDIAGTAGDKHGHELTRLPRMIRQSVSGLAKRSCASLFGGDAIGIAVKRWVSARANWPLCLMLRIGNARNGA